jgi:hypothetical protein
LIFSKLREIKKKVLQVQKAHRTFDSTFKQTENDSNSKNIICRDCKNRIAELQESKQKHGGEHYSALCRDDTIQQIINRALALHLFSKRN